MSKEPKLWLAQIPDCFGYGLMVIETSPSLARVKLRDAYVEMADGYGFGMSFVEAMEYFSGSCEPIEIGKVYSDGFRE